MHASSVNVADKLPDPVSTTTYIDLTHVQQQPDEGSKDKKEKEVKEQVQRTIDVVKADDQVKVSTNKEKQKEKSDSHQEKPAKKHISKHEHISKHHMQTRSLTRSGQKIPAVSQIDREENKYASVSESECEEKRKKVVNTGKRMKSDRPVDKSRVDKYRQGYRKRSANYVPGYGKLKSGQVYRAPVEESSDESSESDEECNGDDRRPMNVIAQQQDIYKIFKQIDKSFHLTWCVSKSNPKISPFSKKAAHAVIAP